MLRWEFRFPPDRVEHLRRIERETGKRPVSLDKKPVLRDELIFFWDVFAQLNRSRGVGFTAEAIKGPDIVAWMDIHEVKDPEIRRQVYEIVTLLDMEWLHLVDLQRKEVSSPKGAST